MNKHPVSSDMGTGYFDHGTKKEGWQVVYYTLKSQKAIFLFVLLICIRFDMVSQYGGINLESVDVSQESEYQIKRGVCFHGWLNS
jgi:hypothetical protein